MYHCLAGIVIWSPMPVISLCTWLSSSSDTFSCVQVLVLGTTTSFVCTFRGCWVHFWESCCRVHFWELSGLAGLVSYPHSASHSPSVFPPHLMLCFHFLDWCMPAKLLNSVGLNHLLPCLWLLTLFWEIPWYICWEWLPYLLRYLCIGTQLHMPHRGHDLGTLVVQVLMCC